MIRIVRSLRVFEQYLEDTVPPDELKALKYSTSKIAVERRDTGKTYRDVT